MAFDRYKFTTVEPGTPSKYKTMIFPEVDKSEEDIYIYSVHGDRFDLFAYEYYKDQTLWFIIAIANNLSVGSLYITPGIQIRIPMKINDYIEKLKDINI